VTKDKLFNLLVARTQTRETSTLAITIIAASASLVLLGFACQVVEEDRIPLVIIGILYPTLGMVFREFIYQTIQKHDFEQIGKFLTNDEMKIVLGGYPTWPRRVIFYLLFAVIPIVAWVLILITEIC